MPPLAAPLAAVAAEGADGAEAASRASRPSDEAVFGTLAEPWAPRALPSLSAKRASMPAGSTSST